MRFFEQDQQAFEQDLHVSLQGRDGMMYIPITTSTSSLYAKAAALEREAAQLELETKRMKLLPGPLLDESDEVLIPRSGWHSRSGSPVPCRLIRNMERSTDLQKDANDADVAHISLPGVSGGEHTELPCSEVDFTPLQFMPTAPVARITQDSSFTTLMMRNIPNDYTRDDVLHLLDSLGFAGLYDFFYLPIDFMRNVGLGYAFVNFVSHISAESARCLLHGFKDWRVQTKKVMEVYWSELSQGLQSNIERYQNSALFHSSVPQEFQPLLFSSGGRVAFPKPTKPIHPPRLKTKGDTCDKSHAVSPKKTIVSGRDSSVGCTPWVWVWVWVDPWAWVECPWDRILKTVSVLNSGNIDKILSHAHKTLPTGVVFCVPKIMDEVCSITEVCTFHQRLHEAIPDLNMSLEKMGWDDQDQGTISWRSNCTGTQVKRFIPEMPIGARAGFTLDVTVKNNKETGRPMWIRWIFGVGSNVSAELCVDDMWRPIVAVGLIPWYRIMKTISIINTGNIDEIVSNARRTLPSSVLFQVPHVADKLQSVKQVCTFHRRLHAAIPDLNLSLEDLSIVDQIEGTISWRVACNGTQVQKFVPHLPVGRRASFTLEVTVKNDKATGSPVSIRWNFGLATKTFENEIGTKIIENETGSDITECTDGSPRSEKVLKHHRGDCTPCAYFAFRADGCRAADECEFCHLCTKSEAKAKKKVKAKLLKSTGQVCDMMYQDVVIYQ